MAEFTYPDWYDVLVVGAGHAGCEAALAAARMGASVLVLTGNLDTVAHMSCNPAIGGVAKGHLVKEIDALGGDMAWVADHTGIQFRRLNASKGPAVRSTRAQADKLRYRELMRRRLEMQPGLALRQGDVARLCLDESGSRAIVRGVTTTMNVTYRARTVILTTGTFLRGKIFVGEERSAGGRVGEAPAMSLTESLVRLGLPVSRLKTGTPCRIDRKTIDVASLELQPGDDPAPLFQNLPVPGFVPPLPQLPCWITYTNEKTHDAIRQGLHRSPMFGGAIEGRGPRYCPSIEDKIVRFADKDRHQIYLEPEGIDSAEVYPNGVSTSLPYDVQLAFLRTIPGLERAEMTRAGYAVEYDFVNPTAVFPTLEVKACEGLYHAGQLNGTSGYEEAAVQGVLAGINAAIACGKGPDSDRSPLVLARDVAYAGVLVDDLTTRGTEEPYRMMTARSEFRLLLREDNTVDRLLPIGRRLGLIDDVRWARHLHIVSAREAAFERAQRAFVLPSPAINDALASYGSAPIADRRVTLAELLRRPELNCAAVEHIARIGGVAGEPSVSIAERVEIEIKYEGYLKRQAVEAARIARADHVTVPVDLDYADIPGLSREVVEKLSTVRPLSVGQASRISGMTPAAVSILLTHLGLLERRANVARTLT